MIRFKIADQDWEFNEVHKLNYETFAEEIPQHSTNREKTLVDKFHEENNYIICLKKNLVAGMIAVRDKRPFSLDLKLDNLKEYIPGHSSICELRLLSIRKGERNRKVIQGLFQYLAQYCEQMKYDLAIISATTTQERLYKTLGFKPFGPLVGTNGARYQPMFLTPGSYFKFKNRTRVLKSTGESTNNNDKILLQPGPVKVKSEVEKAFNAEPISHRSAKFNKLLKDTEKSLCKLTNSSFAQIFMGSGTLANDHIAAQLSIIKGKGLILHNGEFGERLIDHAKRFNLEFDTLYENWGDPFNYKNIARKIKESSYSWLWFVQCETSTGILNDVESLEKICSSNDVLLCVDCISSLGIIDTDLSGVYLASGASGKALAAYPGLSFVIYNKNILPNTSIPRYLDLGYFIQSEGVPFTLSSNLLSAFNKSLQLLDVNKNRDFASGVGEIIRDRLEQMGIEILNDKPNSSPAVITFKICNNLNSIAVGEELEKQNVFLSYRSNYLSEKNLMQFALMGEYDYQDIEQALYKINQIIPLNFL